mgnify:CR=1 FL=1
MKLRENDIQNAVFVADNVPFHKSCQVRNVLAENGHQLLFLPSYSPFINTVEQVFSKWKNCVRSQRPENEQQAQHLI